MTVHTPRVSILVVSYNTKAMTLECLSSVRKFADSSEQEIIVVDNASGDGSADAIAKAFPDIRLIRSTANLGFAGANNLAATHATADYVLLLNPDTLVVENGIGKLVAFADANSNAGIWGGRTLFADMSLNPTSVWRFMSLWSLFMQTTGLSAVFRKSSFCSPESYGKWARDTVREVDIVTGCFLLMKREFWNQLQGFDERFFMYAEEADLCYRARKLGARPLFTPDAEIIHYGGASEAVRADKLRRLWQGKSTFVRKHMSPGKAKLAIGLLQLHAAVRWLGYKTLFILQRRPHQQKAAEQWHSLWSSRSDWSKGYPAKT